MKPALSSQSSPVHSQHIAIGCKCARPLHATGLFNHNPRPATLLLTEHSVQNTRAHHVSHEQHCTSCTTSNLLGVSKHIQCASEAHAAGGKTQSPLKPLEPGSQQPQDPQWANLPQPGLSHYTARGSILLQPKNPNMPMVRNLARATTPAQKPPSLSPEWQKRVCC